jgi:hypothetical protein
MYVLASSGSYMSANKEDTQRPPNTRLSRNSLAHRQYAPASLQAQRISAPAKSPYNDSTIGILTLT